MLLEGGTFFFILDTVCPRLSSSATIRLNVDWEHKGLHIITVTLCANSFTSTVPGYDTNCGD